MTDKLPSQQIDDIIKMHDDWQGKMLSRLRDVIRHADSALIEEVKWKKPSRPEGIPVWSHMGIVCIAESLKNAVRLTFPKGAKLKNQKGLFNARLDSGSVRAIDFHENDTIDEAALKTLIQEAIEQNTSKAN